MRYITALLFILSIGLSAHAHAVGRLADVTILDRTENRVLPVYWHQGKAFVAGQPGHEYQVMINNRSHTDILTVLSVDGVNAVTGDTASWNQSGYVLTPYTGTEVKGWRKSLSTVANFYFTEIEDSYAARTKRPHNVGAIGVAVFRSAYNPPAAPSASIAPESARNQAGGAASDMAAQEKAESDSYAPAPSAKSYARKERRLGTGHGRIENSEVRYTEFERASSKPDEIIVIYYDSYRNLVAQGIIPAKRRMPTPFPGQFVPDPWS